MRALWLVLATSLRVSPWQSLACLGETSGKALMAAAPLFYGILAEGAVRRDLSQLLVAVVGLVGSTAVNYVLQEIGTSARVTQMERVGFAFDAQIAEITARIPTLDHLESARYLDELQTLRQQEGTLGGAFNMTLNVFNNVIFAVTTLAVALTADWRLVLLALLGIPRLLMARWTVRWNKQAEDEASPIGRRANHLIDLAATASGGAELRVFGLQAEIRRRIRSAMYDWHTPGVLLMRRLAGVDGANSLLFFGSAIGVLAWMTHDALQGGVSVRAVVVGVAAIGGLQSVSMTLTGATQMFAGVIRTGNRFRWLREYADSVAATHHGTTPPPAQLGTGIRVEHVTHRYSDADQDSLTDITMDLPAGSIVALVGENGAGKSTLVKLLAGLYRPTAGRILIDGIDLNDLDITGWRQRMSGAFQDHASFELTALESVGVGDLPHLDEPTVRRALDDAAATDVLQALPHGLQTQLGTTWPDGVDISGGQWQRLAIGRGMMRTAPLLLVLDEPTSALDAATEHALFERYAAAAREAGRRGAVTLLVTHRFSTVSAADLVVVLHHGRIIETGTHAELIAAGGHYAELYELQARGYR